MSNIQIRRAVTTDSSSAAQLFDQYRQFYQQPADPAGTRSFITDRIAKADSVILIAACGGTDAGFTQLYPSFSSVSMAPIWILNDLFVASAHRRCGVARALMNAAQEFAENDGAKRLCLATGADNTQAQKLYESQGWQRDPFLHYEFECGEIRSAK